MRTSLAVCAHDPAKQNALKKSAVVRKACRFCAVVRSEHRHSYLSSLHIMLKIRRNVFAVLWSFRLEKGLLPWFLPLQAFQQDMSVIPLSGAHLEMRKTIGETDSRRTSEGKWAHKLHRRSGQGRVGYGRVLQGVDTVGTLECSVLQNNQEGSTGYLPYSIVP